MRFRIEMVSSRPFMVTPNPIPNSGGILPILEHDVPDGSTASATYTVMNNGDITAGGNRSGEWAYVFELWCYHNWKANDGEVHVASGSLVEVTDVNPEYGASYYTHVLINQFVPV